ncbi:response regulator [bacterium]|nr:response regulator [candidate division CSSED10-310 bacterium]
MIVNTTGLKKRYLVLIADYQPSVLKRLYAEFTQRGFDVKVTKSGKMALDYLSRSRVHAILCAERLEDIDGRSFFQKARSHQHGQSVPFLFLSSSQELKNWAQRQRPVPAETVNRSLTSIQLFNTIWEAIQASGHAGQEVMVPFETGLTGTDWEPTADNTMHGITKELTDLIDRIQEILTENDLTPSQIDELGELDTLIKDAKKHLQSNEPGAAMETVQLIRSGLIDILRMRDASISGNMEERDDDREIADGDISDEVPVIADESEAVKKHFDEGDYIERRDSMSKIEQLVESISSIGGITKLVVASRDGTLLSKQGVKGDQFGSVVTFIAISAEHVKTTMGFTQLHHIILNRESGEKILVLLGPKIIVGVELSSSVSPTGVVDSLKPIVNRVTV